MTELGSVSILLSTSLPSPSHSSFINPGGNVLVLLLILSASQKGLHLVQIIAIGFRRGCYLSQLVDGLVDKFHVLSSTRLAKCPCLP